MDVKERILRCRLMEEMAERPEYGKKLGLCGRLVRGDPAAETKEEPDGEMNCPAVSETGETPEENSGVRQKET